METKYFFDVWVLYNGTGVANREAEVFSDGKSPVWYKQYKSNRHTETADKVLDAHKADIENLAQAMIKSTANKKMTIVDAKTIVDGEYKLTVTFYKVTGRNLRNVGDGKMPL